MAVRNAPVRAHEFLADGRLDGADEDGLGAAARITYGIEAEMKAVDQINVGVTRRSIEGAISLCFTDEAVTRGVTYQISLRLHDWASARTARGVADKVVAEQLGRDALRAWLVKGFGQGLENWLHGHSGNLNAWAENSKGEYGPPQRIRTESLMRPGFMTYI